MPEQIQDGNGNSYRMTVNSDGSINTNTNISGGVNVILSGTSLDKVSSLNTYSGTVAINGSWTGSFEDALNYSSINILARPGATGSLYIDYSANGSTALRTSMIATWSGVSAYYSLAPRAQYYRLRYMNDGVLNPIDIHTILSEENRGATYNPMITPLTDNFTALITKSVLAGKAPTGSYINVDVTNGGVLKVSIEDWNGVVGSVYPINSNPAGAIQYNPKTVLVYSGTAIGSIYKNTSTGSIVKVLSYNGSGDLVSASAWSVI